MAVGVCGKEVVSVECGCWIDEQGVRSVTQGGGELGMGI